MFVSLADNIECRLDDNGIISVAAALNPSTWPSNEDERILCGDDKLLTIHNTLAVEAETKPILLQDFHQFKYHGKYQCSPLSTHSLCMKGKDSAP